MRSRDELAEEIALSIIRTGKVTDSLRCVEDSYKTADYMIARRTLLAPAAPVAPPVTPPASGARGTNCPRCGSDFRDSYVTLSKSPLFKGPCRYYDKDFDPWHTAPAPSPAGDEAKIRYFAHDADVKCDDAGDEKHVFTVEACGPDHSARLATWVAEQLNIARAGRRAT